MLRIKQNQEKAGLPQTQTRGQDNRPPLQNRRTATDTATKPRVKKLLIYSQQNNKYDFKAISLPNGVQIQLGAAGGRTGWRRPVAFCPFTHPTPTIK